MKAMGWFLDGNCLDAKAIGSLDQVELSEGRMVQMQSRMSDFRMCVT